jgi:uncharacterized membrane-anchored protein
MEYRDHHPEAEAERDRAVEEATFLREQLRSTQAYLAQLLESELANERADRAALLAEIVVLNDELEARAPASRAPASSAGAKSVVAD